MTAIPALLLDVLRVFLFGWLVALLALLRQLYARGKSHLPPGKCVPLRDPAVHRPDPLIYDQRYLMSLGLAVTWDNPDVEFRHNGVVVRPEDLVQDTTYEIVARVWNSSTDAPVVDLPVRFSYLDFGIGTVSLPIGSTTTNLGVKGGPGCPAFASVLWTTPHKTGHFCVQVELEWADDANPANNLGQCNVHLAKAQSPAHFQFQLRNDTAESMTFRFEADTYTIPGRQPCDDSPPPPRDPRRRGRPVDGGVTAARLDRARERHDRAAHLLPPGWAIGLVPDAPTLAPGEDVLIKAVITVPEGFSGRLPVNVHAFHRLGLAGGVTLLVEGAQ